MKNEIFIALSTYAEYGKTPLMLLQESGVHYSLNHLGRRLIRQEIVEMGLNATGIVAGVEPYDSEVLSHLPNLKCISRAGVGVDNIDLDYANNRNIIIKNTPDVVIRPVAELTLAMVFDLLRKITYHTTILKERRWEKSAGSLLLGKNIGIIGTGRIGKATAELLMKLGAKILACDLAPDKKWARLHDITYVPFNKLISTSDIISLHLSSIKDDMPLLGEYEMNMMKHGVMIINTSRGEFIDEIALCNALETGQVGSAGLDVFPEEPYDGKLLNFSNVVVTPHVATLTRESRLQMEVEATQNLINVLTTNTRE